MAAIGLGVGFWIRDPVRGLLGAMGACSRATVSGLIPPGRRGLGMGAFHACEGAGLLVASVKSTKPMLARPITDSSAASCQARTPAARLWHAAPRPAAQPTPCPP